MLAEGSAAGRFAQKTLPHTGVSSGNAVACVLFLSGTLCIRPTYLGETYAPFGTALMLAGSFIAASLPGSRLRFRETFTLPAWSACLMWFFLTVHSYAMGTASYFPIAATVLISTSVFAACIFFSVRGLESLFAAFFRYYLCIMSLSFIITAFLVFALRIPVTSLGVFKLYSKTYTDSGDVLFPFTMVYEWRYYDFGLFVRPTAGFRESGIAQAFYSWAILTVPYERSKTNTSVYWLLVIGSLSTQSAFGIAMTGLAMSMRYIRTARLNMRTLCLLPFAALILSSAMFFAVSDDQVGLASKLNNESYTDRAIAFDEGVRAFLDNPMGFGTYNDTGNYHQGISLIASLGSLGMPGLILVLFQISVVVLSSGRRFAKALTIAPIFLTGLLTQPLLDAALVFVIYMVEPTPADSSGKTPTVHP